MYPNHPNLLYATYDDDEAHAEVISQRQLVGKPKYGREGHGVVYSKDHSKAINFMMTAKEASEVGFMFLLCNIMRVYMEAVYMTYECKHVSM